MVIYSFKDKLKSFMREYNWSLEYTTDEDGNTTSKTSSTELDFNEIILLVIQLIIKLIH